MVPAKRLGKERAGRRLSGDIGSATKETIPLGREGRHGGISTRWGERYTTETS